MSSIPHPLQCQIAMLLVNAQARLSTRARSRLSFVLWAVLLSGTVVQRQIASTVASIAPNDGDASSHERRLRRTIHDCRLTWEAVFAPLVRFVLRNLTGTVTVIVDETGHTDVVRVLTAAVWYQSRAIPLAWVVWKGQTPHDTSYWQDCQLLLDRVASVLPAQLTVIVVADRAFGCPAFLDPITAHGWHYVVRVQGQTRLKHNDGSEQPFKGKVNEPGKHWWGRVRVFKKQGWREATVVAYWRHGCSEPLLLVSSLALAMQSVRVYRWRSAIEALFRDWKSYGFWWERSQVRDVAHQERLIVLLALATVVTLLLGVEAAQEIVAQAAQQGTRRPWEARDSLFQLGRGRCRTRIWTRSEVPLPDGFPPPGTRPWFQVCWAHAAPAAKQASVENGQVRHHR